MRIAVISSRFPYPTEKGDKLRLFNQIVQLSKEHEIHLFSLVDQHFESKYLSKLNPYCKSVHTFPINSISSLLGLILNVFGRMPFQCSYFYRSWTARKMRKEIKMIKPDMIYCQLLRMAPYVRPLKYIKIIDYMDSFSLIMKRRAKNAGIFSKWLFQIEERRLKKYENEVFPWFNKHLMISSQDSSEFPSKLSSKIHIIPNGVDLEYFVPNPESKPKFDVVFIGNLGYHPNVVAARYLIKMIKPLLDDAGHRLRFLIAGARPAPSLKAIQSKVVEVKGWQEDIRASYWDGKIFVAPIFTGAGQQNKILEAMASGIPCITSDQVNKSIGAIPDQQILIANSPSEFANKIKWLIENLEARKMLIKNGREFVESQYSWERVGEKFSRLIIEM